MSIRDKLREYEPPEETHGRVSQLFEQSSGGGQAVRPSRELTRILSVPRRAPVHGDPHELTAALRRAGGTIDLRPVQAQALTEFDAVGGLIGNMPAGSGKTLVSYVAPFVAQARKTVLIVPAALVDKTRADFRVLAAHLDGEPTPAIVSYEALALSHYAHYLGDITPDLIILDEAHRCKNPKSAVTRRVARYLEDTPACKVIVLSGTILGAELAQAAHLFDWALREHSPLPRDYPTIVEWGLAVDHDVQTRLAPGDLARLGTFDGIDTRHDATERARMLVRDRVLATRGVVSMPDADVGASLRVTLTIKEPDVRDAYERIEAAWELPDGTPIADASRKAGHECELAQGFYYRPRKPPHEWAVARREWCQIVRHVLAHNQRGLDTEKQLAQAILAGHYTGKKAISGGREVGTGTIDEIYARWIALRDTFNVERETVWLTPAIVEHARVWAAEAPGVVWCGSRGMLEALGAFLPTYGDSATDPSGENGTHSIACSIASHGTGKNLQAFARALVIAPGLPPEAWEQLLARHHRPGQRADEVHFEVLIGCGRQYARFVDARAGALAIEQKSGINQRLRYGDVIVPQPGIGPRWACLG